MNYYCHEVKDLNAADSLLIHHSRSRLLFNLSHFLGDNIDLPSHASTVHQQNESKI